MAITTMVKVIVPPGKTPKEFKNEIKAEALRRNLNSQEFVTLAVNNELTAKVVKQESCK
jgi:hypothetical protein